MVEICEPSTITLLIVIEIIILAGLVAYKYSKSFITAFVVQEVLLAFMLLIYPFIHGILGGL